MKLHLLTVLHNRKLASCEVWESLLQPAMQEREQEISCTIVDNSTEEQYRMANAAFVARQGMTYVDMKGNQGLAAAYNRALRVIAESRKDEWGSNPSRIGQEWILITDQDTIFPEDYLSVLEKTAAETSASVLAPTVKSGTVLLSPCRIQGVRFRPCEKEEQIAKQLRDLFFINSGLALRADLFFVDGLTYDEHLFLDFVDFDLENRIRQKQKEGFACLLQVTVQQHFSGLERHSAEEDLVRYQQYMRDGRYFYRKWAKKQPFSDWYLRLRGWKLALRHRDVRFLKRA